MKAVRYRTGSGEFRIGRLDGDQVVDAGPAGRAGVHPDAGRVGGAGGGRRAAHGALRGRRSPHPVVPRKLICIGLNYRDHAEESELDLPEVPVIFAKWTTSLIGHGETIVIPREETRPDYEGELAVVIGERGLPGDR